MNTTQNQIIKNSSTWITNPLSATQLNWSKELLSSKVLQTPQVDMINFHKKLHIQFVFNFIWWKCLTYWFHYFTLLVHLFFWLFSLTSMPLVTFFRPFKMSLVNIFMWFYTEKANIFVFPSNLLTFWYKENIYLNMLKKFSKIWKMSPALIFL